MLKRLTQFLRPKQDLQSGEQIHSIPEQDVDGWITPYPSAILLQTELRQRYLSLLWQQVSMTREMFDNLYRKPIEKYAEMVQLLPASEAHHHAHLGGLLDHGLEVISFAAKLRQNYVLPANAAPEEQAKQKDAWTAATIYLALVHDIGKSIVDIEIQLKNGKRWFAWNGVPTEAYKFKYIKQRDYELHPVLGSFLASYLIPKQAFDWLATYPEAFSALMYAISGHYDKAGILAEIVQKADQNSVALALGGDITKLVQKPVVSFAKQLVLALRHLVVEKLKLNPKGPGDGWLTEDGLWLMSKTTADQIRAYLMEQGINVPGDNRKLFDEMQAHNIIDSTPENTAIWYCQIKADAGWKTKDKFSLLRIKPEIVWECIDDRPPLFSGNVFIVEKENNEKKEPIIDEVSKENEDVKLSTSETALKIVDVANKKNGDEITNSDNSSVDFLLNMFSNNEPINNHKIVDSPPNFETVIDISKVETVQAERLELVEDVIQKQNKSELKENNNEGQKFVDWLRDKLITGKMTFNDRNAKVHIVNNSLFLVSPSSFEIYLQEQGVPYNEERINNLQYAFQKLDLHKKRIIENDTTNFWRCKVIGPRKDSFLIGYLIPDTKLFFGEKILLDNRHLLLEE